MACTCAGQDEAKPVGTKQEKQPLDMHLMRWRQIGASLTSTVSFMMRLTLHKIHVKPYLGMAALIGLSDA